MEYIQANKDEPPDRGCVFCAALKGEEDGERILRRDEHAFVTLAKYPYNPGHLLVLPVRHVGELEELTVEESVDIASLLQELNREGRTLVLVTHNDALAARATRQVRLRDGGLAR